MSASDKSPTADVYAADTSSPTTVDASESAICFFDVEADCEPCTFARIANVLTIANVSPSCVILGHKTNGGTLSVYIELAIGLNLENPIKRKMNKVTDE